MSKNAIAERGFFIFPPLFSGDELERISDSLAGSSIKRSRAGIRHVLKIESVTETARDPRLIDIARALLGPTALPFHATLFEKSPNANWLVVWHQDTALPLRERSERPGWGPWSMKEGINYAHAPAGALSQVLALRLHLDDSTADNGPLRVLPGTHDRGVLTDDTIHELSRQITPVDCLAESGGVVAMRPLIVHASSKSLNDAPRRVLHIEYAASLKIDNGLELELA
jgi:ectoine hydroxylase-related dioxygenase (phytanoyl-CoA dioxygenase family)